MMVAVIVTPTLVILIVQVATFPLTLYAVATVNEVCTKVLHLKIYNSFITYRMTFPQRKYILSVVECTNIYFQV